MAKHHLIKFATLCKVWHKIGMKNVEKSPLNPSFWRTCRALANRNRLKLMSELMTHGPRTVSQIARSMGWPESTSSQYLRLLNARGLLQIARTGPYAIYRPEGNSKIYFANRLLDALNKAFIKDMHDTEYVFKHLTAFTHERRIRMIKELIRAPQSAQELASSSSVSLRALYRHLAKFETRGYVSYDKGSRKYLLSAAEEALPATLIKLAAEG